MNSKFLILILSSIGFTSQLHGQKPVNYTNQKEYKTALILYNDKLESHLNYERKMNYYKNLKFPSKEAQYKSNTDWIDYFKGKLLKYGVFFDNELVRYKPNVEPDGEKWVNLILTEGSQYLQVRITDQPLYELTESIYCASTYYFKHPGLPPTYTPPPKKKVIKKKEVVVQEIPSVKTDSVVVTQIITPIEVRECDFYVMPDGNTYTRLELKTRWNIDERILRGNFKNLKE